MEGLECRSQLPHHRVGWVKEQSTQAVVQLFRRGSRSRWSPGTHSDTSHLQRGKAAPCLCAAAAFDLTCGKSGVMSLRGYPGALGVLQGE